MNISLAKNFTNNHGKYNILIFNIIFIIAVCQTAIAQNDFPLSQINPISPGSSEPLQIHRPSSAKTKQIQYTPEDMAAREAILRQKRTVRQANPDRKQAILKALKWKAQFHSEDNQDSPSGSNQIGFGTVFESNGLHVNDITGEVRLKLPVLGDGVLQISPLARIYYNPNQFDIFNQTVGPFGWGTAGIGPVNDRLWGFAYFDQNGNTVEGPGYFEYWENGVKSFFYKDHLFTDWEPSADIPWLEMDPNPGRHYIDKRLNRLEIFPPDHEFWAVIRKTTGTSIYFQRHPVFLLPLPVKVTSPSGSTLWVFHEKNDIDPATGLERRLLYRDDYGRELIAYFEEVVFVKKIVMKDSANSQETLLGTFYRDEIGDLIAFETPEGYRTELEWHQILYDGLTFKRSELKTITTPQKGTIDIEYDYYYGDNPVGGTWGVYPFVRRVKSLNFHDKVQIAYDYGTGYESVDDGTGVVLYPHERVVVKESFAVDSQQSIKEVTKYHAGLLFNYWGGLGSEFYLAGFYSSGKPFHKVTNYTAKSGEFSSKTETWEWKPFHAWTNRDAAQVSSWRPAMNSFWWVDQSCPPLICDPPFVFYQYNGGHGFCLPRLKKYSHEQDGHWTDIDYEYRFDHDEPTQTNRDFDFQNELLAPSKIIKRLRSHPENFVVTELNYQKIAQMGLQRDQPSGESIYQLDLLTSKTTTFFVDLQMAGMNQEAHTYDDKGRLLESKNDLRFGLPRFSLNGLPILCRAGGGNALDPKLSG